MADWLDIEALKQNATEIIADFKKQYPGVSATPVRLVKFFEDSRGPIVVRPVNQYDYERDLYLVPAIDSLSSPGNKLGVSSRDIPVNTKTPPGQVSLFPLKLHPSLAAAAAVAEASVGSTKKLGLKRTGSAGGEAAQKNEKDNGFSWSIDVGVAPNPADGRAGLSRDKPEAEDPAPRDTQEPIDPPFEVKTLADVKYMLKAQAGLSIDVHRKQPPETRNSSPSRNKVLTTVNYKGPIKQHQVGKGFSDLCGMNEEIENPYAEAVRPNELVQIVAQLGVGESPDINSRKALLKAERVRRHNEIDKWFGMKRQKIDEDTRRELLALELRGFADPKKRYRSRKRKLALARADSGFFQIGHEISGGLANVRVGESGVVSRYGTSKKGRSLVKNLLVK